MKTNTEELGNVKISNSQRILGVSSCSKKMVADAGHSFSRAPGSLDCHYRRLCVGAVYIYNILRAQVIVTPQTG